MYLFFDVETTGLPKNRFAPIDDFDNWPRIVQIAWLVYDDSEKCTSEKKHIIKPQNFTIPESAANIHGITTEIALSEGNDLKSVLEVFSADVKKAECVIAHNMSFDVRVVGAELLRERIDHVLFETPRMCTMRSSTGYCKIPRPAGGYKWPNLIELHSFLFKCNFENVHDAFADVKACAKCYFELKKRGIMR